jgi:regulator of sigma E protease
MLSGPVGIAQIAGAAAESQDWLSKFSTLAIISLNLAIFNLLPFPIVDGGLIAMLLFESVRRKDISIDTKEQIYKFAFTAIAVFFVVVLINDVTKLDFFAHGK